MISVRSVISWVRPEIPPAAEPPLLPRVRPVTAYATAVAFFLIFFGPGVVNAVGYGYSHALLAWADRHGMTLWHALFLAGAVWLAYLLARARLAPLHRIGALAVLAVVAYGHVFTALIHQPITGVCFFYADWAALAVALAVLLARSIGLDRSAAGLPPHRSLTVRDRRTPIIEAEQIFTVSLNGCVLTGVGAWLISILTFTGIPNPIKMSGFHYLSSGIAAAIHAGICEETIMVAVLVTALEAARRPAWEIYTLGIVIRLSIHLYYGPMALAVAIMAATQLWAYRRWHRLAPLIVAHIWVDTYGTVRTLYGWPIAIGFGIIAVTAINLTLAFIFKKLPDPPDTPPSEPDQPSPTPAPVRA